MMRLLFHGYTANKACQVTTPTVAKSRTSPRNLRKKLGIAVFLLKRSYLNVPGIKFSVRENFISDIHPGFPTSIASECHYRGCPNIRSNTSSIEMAAVIFLIHQPL
jgi:hypothetical protein